MQYIQNFITEKLIINKNTKINKYHYHPKDKDELRELVLKLIRERGTKADLNDIDTSKIDNMAGIFLNSDFNGDISEWDVSNVKNMLLMFNNSLFDGDLSKWDVHNVETMASMFAKSQFTGERGDISNWNIKPNVRMGSMFKNCPLEKNPPSWYHKK